jgi:uncharacterized protein (DUF885 family)
MTLLPLLAVALVSCVPRTSPEVAAASLTAAPPVSSAVVGVVNPLLAQLVGEHWEATLARSPTFASEIGDHRYDDRWTDPSDEALQAWLRRQRETELALAALPDELLSRTDRVTRDLLLENVRAELAERSCRFEEWSVSARDNDLVTLRSVIGQVTLGTDAERSALLARYRGYAAVVDAHTALLRRGLAAGRVSNRTSLEKVIAMYDAALAEAPTTRPEHTLLVDGTLERPFTADELAAFDLAFDEQIRPALQRQRDVLRDELLPAARTGDDVGLHALPEGRACYAARVRTATTLPLEPEVLHQRGLDEMARIHQEFRVLGKAALGTDDLPVIFRRLREDPALRFSTPEEIRAVAESALRRAEAAVPTWFEHVPTTKCEVDVVPDYLAPFTTIAYYEPGLADGSRPGKYVVNVFSPTTRPRHEAEVLAFHESVPGHHLQIATNRELGDLPLFRQYAQYDAFVEGWALYSERLADEMGLYTSDVDRLGMLSFDAWRAGRLVVDTGIHAQGWSRERAEAWLLENTPLMPDNVVNEVDRYATWPGQALAYKTGQLQILALRARAEERLGAAFRPAAFHRVVLEQGAVTLPLLDAHVERWIEDTSESSEVSP